jgi:hypothetical protein
MDADLLRRYLEFYQDLGIKTLYRRAEAHAEAGGTACPTTENEGCAGGRPSETRRRCGWRRMAR